MKSTRYKWEDNAKKGWVGDLVQNADSGFCGASNAASCLPTGTVFNRHLPPLHCTVQALNCRLDLVCCAYIIMYISHCKIYDWNSMSIPACIRCYLTDTLSRPSPEISKCPYSDKYITLSHWDTRTKQGRHGWEGWWGKKWWQKEGYQWQSTSRLSGLTWQKKQWTNLTKLQDTV